MNDSPERYLRTVSDQGEEILHELSIEMLGHYWRHQWLDNGEAITALLALMVEWQQGAETLQELNVQLSQKVDRLARGGEVADE